MIVYYFTLHLIQHFHSKSECILYYTLTWNNGTVIALNNNTLLGDFGKYRSMCKCKNKTQNVFVAAVINSIIMDDILGDRK